MATITNIHAAKTQLSQLLEQVVAGKEVIIGKYGKPIAKIVPYTQEILPPRVPGKWKGKIFISPDFDEVDEEITKLFEKNIDENID